MHDYLGIVDVFLHQSSARFEKLTNIKTRLKLLLIRNISTPPVESILTLVPAYLHFIVSAKLQSSSVPTSTQTTLLLLLVMLLPTASKTFS